MSAKHNSFLRLLKKKGFKEENTTKVEVYAIGTSTTLESNKSQGRFGFVGIWFLHVLYTPLEGRMTCGYGYHLSS